MELQVVWYALIAVLWIGYFVLEGFDFGVGMLLALADGRTIESVLLPGDGVCVSTQVGCAVGCVFCMTGRFGVERQLRSAEIVAQVALAAARAAARSALVRTEAERDPAALSARAAESLARSRRAMREEQKSLVASVKEVATLMKPTVRLF